MNTEKNGCTCKPENGHGADEARTSLQVTEYFEQVGLKQWSTMQDFGDYILEKYGPTGLNLLKIMPMPGDRVSADFYHLKNQFLQLSIDISSLSGKLYDYYLSWWMRQEFPPPHRLLDLGCDCGILTCFYASIYPEAEVLGVDICEAAVSRAQELAKKLGLSNIRFGVQAIKDIGNISRAAPYDLITSTAVMHEVHSFPNDFGIWGLEELDLDKGMEPLQQILTGIRKMMNPDSGLLIDIGPWAVSPQLVRWVRALNHAGLKADWERCNNLSCKTADGEQARSIITVALPDDSCPQQDIDEVLASESYHDFKIAPDAEFENAAAYLLFRAFPEKTRVFGVEIDYRDKRAIERKEIWRAGQIAFLYQYNNLWGPRKLMFFAIQIVDDLIRQLMFEAGEISPPARLRMAHDGSDYNLAIPIEL